MEIREDDPGSSALAELLAQHVAFGRAHTPPENTHVLVPDRLRDPAITFWTAWEGETLLGMVALKQIAPDHAEVKSMRTADAALRRGVGRALLDHLLAVACARGYRRVRLETGTAPPFDPATRLYEQAGFVDGPAFGGYPASPHNRFMYLDL
ncbi:GNAT family N-acetyltransferase [Sphingomonas sp.]|uniref:GNAT family N-acetyltransferase n=1 Tax=Sphingomonas sp. TaxID=28214 RepID=UPI003CC5CE1F